MLSRHITDVNLQKMTPAQVAVLHMDNDLYLSLRHDRDGLIEDLLHAPSNSDRATELIDSLSIIVAVLDAFEELHGLREAA